MLYQCLLALCFLTASSLAAQTKKTCYSLDGQELDGRFQPCNPDAEFSSCCALDGTDGENDICMDSGLCMSTSGWFSTYLWANGCTDPTGKAKACPQQCNFMPSGYSFNVLQCDANNGSFCCRSGSDEDNCCTTESRVFQAATTIGQILLPGTDQVVNTTYSTILPNSSKDHSRVVGGVVGGVLGAALIASLIALFMLLRSRKALRNDYSSLQQDRDTLLQQGFNEKAALQQELEQQRLAYQQYHMAQAPTYTPAQQYPAAYYQASAALPMPMGTDSRGYPTEVSGLARPVEMDTMRGASELSDETASQKVERTEVSPNKAD
ncbi:hypothetical protein CLCR_01223 [Cladophialophora carrionii]|uniref:Uncharacterized protein n=1 Tax=Cladophialophora carrionii TaxID=86049 RepID=A0A1C1CCV7_9EURO|nr:hypothetical protein CLCR_01223 [Cladophialophora carrionii]